MTTTYLKAIALSGALLAAPPFLSAQESQPQKSQAMQQQQASAGEQKPVRAAIVGQIQDSRDVQLSGAAGDAHRLYKVRTAEGKNMVLDIGQVQGQQVELSQGDLVIAIGNKARINGRPVLFARYYGAANQAGRGATETRDVSQID